MTQSIRYQLAYYAARRRAATRRRRAAILGVALTIGAAIAFWSCIAGLIF